MRIKIIIGMALVVSFGLGILIWQMARSETDSGPHHTAERPTVRHVPPLRDKQQISAELKRRLQTIKNSATAERQVMASQPLLATATTRSNQRKQARDLIEASQKLDGLLAKNKKVASIGSEHQRAASGVLAQRSDHLLSIAEVTCTAAFCRLTFQTTRMDGLEEIIEDFTQSSWPWSGKPYMVFTRQRAPLHGAEQLDDGTSMILEVNVYASTSQQTLPVAKALQKKEKR